jgi:anti-sigma-K factor RskA
MKYFAQIEAYINGKMSSAERQAFEHEVEDNADLARELDAYQSGADLFNFAAAQLSEEQILHPDKQGISSGGPGKKPFFTYSRLAIFLAAAIGLCLIVFLGGYLQDDQQETVPVQPIEQQKQPAKNRPVAAAPSPEVPSGEEEQLLAKAESREPVTKMTPEQKNEIKQPASSSQSRPSKVMAHLNDESTKSTHASAPADAELIADQAIASGEKIVYQASQQITLKPGFHAKAGSVFRAVVEND